MLQGNVSTTTPAAPIASQVPEGITKSAMQAASDILQKSAERQKAAEAANKAANATTEPVKEAPAQLKTEEGVKTEPVIAEPEKKEDPQSKRFAALAKREAAIVKRDQDLKTKEAQLTEKEKQLGGFEQRELDRKKEVALNPLKALEYYGISYQQLTDFILKGEKPTPEMEIQAVRDELGSFKKQSEEERQRLIADQKRAVQEEHERTLDQFRKGVGEFVKANTDKYELTNLYGGTDIVIATIEEHFTKTKEETGNGVVLGMDEAAELVEKYFEDQAKLLEKTKKFAKVNPQPEGELKPDPKALQRTNTTLTNNMSSSTPSFIPAKSENERMARALAALDRK